jgi:hypothetical protein
LRFRLGDGITVSSVCEHVFVVAMLVPDALDDIETELRGYLADLDPDAVPVFAAERVFTQLATIERLASSALVLMARRVEDGGGHREAGCRNAAEQIAKAVGGSVSGAKRRWKQAGSSKRCRWWATRYATACCRRRR